MVEGEEGALHPQETWVEEAYLEATATLEGQPEEAEFLTDTEVTAGQKDYEAMGEI